MSQLLNALQSEEIIAAKNSPGGTQLKLLLNFRGSHVVLFKPGWYKRDFIVDGSLIYAGKDRHVSEIFAFYLGAVLNLRWTPIVAGRKINLKEIYEKADKDLKETMTISNGTKYCLYGRCHYCKPTDSICGDSNHDIEGVILNLIPGKLAKHRSPWQRTYKVGEKAEWELDNNYCEPLKKQLTQTRLLDLVDSSIFDFLIQNGDRHHYETRNDRLVLLDNGKGFGNPFQDFIDILAPLYQCCM